MRRASRKNSSQGNRTIKLPVSQTGLTVLQAVSPVARQAGDMLLERRNTAKHVERKPGTANIVTDADLESQRIILEGLGREFPNIGALSEESSGDAASFSDGWVIDPLDGTANYAFGVPHFCVNIALVQQSEVVFGLTYDPARGEVFHAIKGEGAFLNGSGIAVSKRDNLKDSYIGCDLGYDAQQGFRVISRIRAAWPNVHGLRLMGSSALGLAYVACGRFDVYFHASLYPWDVAPGILLVSEAGGAVSDWDGEPAAFRSKEVFAHNRLVREEFVGYVLNNIEAV